MGSTQSTGTMKAVVRANSTVGLNTEWPMPPNPKPNTNGVIIRVRAAGINPVDYKLPKFMGGTLVGFDVAGVIETIAEGNVTHDFKVGDAVYGKAHGSLVEFAIADAGEIARKPKELSFVEAAAMNVTYMTGLLALTNYGGLKEGGRLLIIGASGGTGTAGIQIAKSLKAGEIVAICSGKNEEMVRSLGATKMIDYKTTNFVDVYADAKDEEKFDVVYDCASFSGHGEDYTEDSRRVLRVGPPAGQYVAINGSKTMWVRAQVNMLPANYHLFISKTTTKSLDTISKLVSEEGLRPVIAETHPFTVEGVENAFTQLKGRRTVGKIVLDMEKGSSSTDEVKTGEHVEDTKAQPVEDNKAPTEDAKVEVVPDAEDAKVEVVPEVKEKPSEEPQVDKEKPQPTSETQVGEEKSKP